MFVVLILAVAGPGVSMGQVFNPPLFAPPAAGASETLPEDVAVSGYYDWGGMTFRLQHRSHYYGEEAGKSSFGLNKTFVFERIAVFGDGAFRVDDENRTTASAGGGFRFLYTDWLLKRDRIFGASFWYDGDETVYQYDQFGVALENLGDRWDFRLNLNVPVGQRNHEVRSARGVDSLSFNAHNLIQGIWLNTESSMTVLDFEVSRRLLNRNIWGFAGLYYLDGGGEQEVGFQGGLRGYVTPALSVSLSGSNDPIFDSTIAFNVSWFFNVKPPRQSVMSPACLIDRLREPVRRNDYVAVWNRTEESTEILTDEDGEELYFVHVDSAAAAGGDGTYESPYATLADAQSNSSAGNYVFLHSDSVFNGESITLKDNQKLLGDGVSGGHQVATSEFGTVTLPTVAGAVPVIQNAPATAITLADGNLVSGVDIEGGVTGISAPGSASGTVDRVNVSNTTGMGVNLDTATGTFAFTETTITDTGGTAFNVDGGSASATFTGLITQSNNAAAVAVSGGHTGTLTFTPLNAGDDVITATNGTGLQFDNADGTYSFGQLTLNGGDAGVDIVNGSAGTFAFSDATITSPTGTAFNVEGGSANVAFTGLITQANNVAAVSVSGGHTGTLVFTPLAAGDDVITATNGTGLQFDNADGTYTFGQLTLNGGDAGVDVVNDSAGTFTFSDATITSPTGVAFNVDASSANVAFTGLITQANDVATVSVTGGDTSTLTFSPVTAGDDVITATNGTGLQFDDADGTYTFGQLSLNGGDAGVDIVNDSAGTFTFSNATITSPTGIAFNVDASSATVGFTGLITQANDVATVSVTGGDTSTLTFSPVTSGDDVITATNGTGLQFNNADGTYTFGQLSLNGGDASIDIVNDSEGAFTFSDATITNPTGTALTVDGSAATVALGGTIENDADHSIEITNNTGGTVTVAADITDTGEGILVDGNTGGTTSFTGQLTLNTTTNDAVTLSNNTGATVNFSGGLAIDTTSGAGFVASGGGTVSVTGSSNTINTTTGTGLDVSDMTVGASGMSFQSISVDGAVNGIVLDTVTGGTISIGSGGSSAGDGGDLLNTTGDAVSVTNVANLSLNYLNINTTGGDGVNIVHNDANASSISLNNSDIAGFTGQGIELAATGAGTLTLVLDGNDISGATGGESILLNVNDSASQVNLTVTDNLALNGNNDVALSLNVAGAGAKTVTTLIDGNTFISNSASSTIDIADTGNARMNTTITDNNLTNSGAGDELDVVSNNAAAWIRLDLNGNTADAGAGNFNLTNTAGTFTVLDLTDVNANNTGTVNTAGTIVNDPGPIPTP